MPPRERTIYDDDVRVYDELLDQAHMRPSYSESKPCRKCGTPIVKSEQPTGYHKRTLCTGCK